MKLDLEIAVAIWNGTDAEVLARVISRDARNRVPAKPADIASIVWTNTANGVQVSSGTFVVADTILPEVSYGTIWTVDSRGFNFHGMITTDKLVAGTNLILVTLTTTGSPARKGSFVVRLLVA